MRQPDFSIGDLPVYGRLILAPMDGFSDPPFRRLCRDYGSAMSYTAFVGAPAVLHATEQARLALTYREDERPVVFQLFDDDEDQLAEAALRLLDLGPDVIDLNMGCSARCVAGRGAGAGLLRDPRKVGRIVRRLAHLLPIPVTAKIRLGWDDSSRNYLEVARAIEDNGGRLIAVHGRTKAQGYGGDADWSPIGEIKASVGIPVIGNGDIRSAAEAELRLAETGVDAVMIGRAAIGNPWIFQGRSARPPTSDQVLSTIRQHLREMVRTYGDARGPLLFRKHLSRYLAHLDAAAPLRPSLLTSLTADEIERLLDQLASRPHRLPRLHRLAALEPAGL